MLLKTSQFGDLEYDQEAVIKFPNGIPGFDDENAFVLIPSGDVNFPFNTLQSEHTPELAFVVTDPFLFVENYDFEISEYDVEALKLKSEEDLKNIIALSIVTIPDNVENTTINIVAPIIINTKDKIGKQVLLHEYDDVKYPIFTKKSEE